jgi:hypothetical protein
VGGEIVEQLNHQVELSEPLGQILFVGLVLFKVVIQSLKDCYYPVRSSRWEENGRYLKQGQERSAKLAKNMVDLRIKRIGLEQRSPSLENGVRDLEHTNVDGRVGRRQLGNKILSRPKGQHCIITLDWTTYIHESLPLLPEVTVGDHTDGLTQLALNAWRDRDHQVDQLALEGLDLIALQLVVSVLIGPVPLDEVLEAKGTSKACVVGRGIRCGDVKKL